jgi:hypothetical protein
LATSTLVLEEVVLGPRSNPEVKKETSESLFFCLDLLEKKRSQNILLTENHLYMVFMEQAKGTTETSSPSTGVPFHQAEQPQVRAAITPRMNKIRSSLKRWSSMLVK